MPNRDQDQNSNNPKEMRNERSNLSSQAIDKNKRTQQAGSSSRSDSSADSGRDQQNR